MKTLMIVLALFVFSCDWDYGVDRGFITFDSVSQPYIEQYGEPEEVDSYTSQSYESVDWRWWSQGVNVHFANTIYDDVNGWYVSSVYYFEPI